MSEHTPTPWRVTESDGVMDSKARFETGSRVLIFSDDCEYHPIADCSCNHTCRMPDEQEANAALIVRAVNSHDSLVNALREIGLACDGPLSYSRSFLADKVADIAREALARIAGAVGAQKET